MVEGANKQTNNSVCGSVWFSLRGSMVSQMPFLGSFLSGCGFCREERGGEVWVDVLVSGQGTGMEVICRYRWVVVKGLVRAFLVYRRCRTDRRWDSRTYNIDSVAKGKGKE